MQEEFGRTNAEGDEALRQRAEGSLDSDELLKIDAYWRATLYLCVGMIYLQDNPLLRKPLEIGHIKNRLLGHWGSDPGQTFTWVHLNRLIKKHDLNMVFVSGPGHGAPSVLANAYLEGTYSEVYPDKSEDEEGMRRFFKQFSFPGGIGSHCTPETPGSFHEGGELGYSLSHAYGAAFDNPDLIVNVMIGDGEAETGPLATAWHSNKFLNPVRDGAVLPILHLNGYKIANPTILGRMDHKQIESLFVGYGYKPYFVEGSDPPAMHQMMAGTLEEVFADIRTTQDQARSRGICELPEWPMIILRSPKGWTGPKEVDGHKVEGFWRAHQVPFDVHENASHLALLQEWMRSYKPEELFDESGRLIPELKELAPRGHRRMSANPLTNGGTVRKDLRLPDFRSYAANVTKPGTTRVENTRPLGDFLRDTLIQNRTNFRFFCPDETSSNRLDAVYQASEKVWMEEIKPEDADGTHLAREGQVMEMLSEHTLEGWLEGYLLTGRHGFFASYEAFVHVIDSMFNQHAKWLEKCREVSWRAPLPSLNLLITSTVWRQDHNGFSHQDPGFLDLVTNKSANVTRIYLPPDVNCLLSVVDHSLRSTNYVNVIVCDKQPHLQYLSVDEAVQHCAKGIGIWEWASNDQGSEPDVVLAAAGDIPTMEALAAIALLRPRFPDLKIRFINVLDLYKLQPPSEHKHGLPDRDFDGLFTTDKPIIFNFHGYPWLIHKLAYRRNGHKNLHVRGYKEQGNIDTPLALAMKNQIDRFNLAIDVIDRVPKLNVVGAHAKEWLKGQIIANFDYAHEHGTDKPEYTGWTWPFDADRTK
jgi:xylulose-5-phosphate/fructose-6-phosphate phosphoketolase